MIPELALTAAAMLFYWISTFAFGYSLRTRDVRWLVLGWYFYLCGLMLTLTHYSPPDWSGGLVEWVEIALFSLLFSGSSFGSGFVAGKHQES